jgi:hypothetical protein
MANPKGQLRDKPFRDALNVEAKLAEAGEPTPANKGSLRFIARMMLERAADDTPTAREVADRLDGKPAQALEHSGPEGGAIVTQDVTAMEVARRIAHLLKKKE